MPFLIFAINASRFTLTLRKRSLEHNVSGIGDIHYSYNTSEEMFSTIRQTLTSLDPYRYYCCEWSFCRQLAYGRATCATAYLLGPAYAVYTA